MTASFAISNNPLLKCSGLPAFTEIKPEHVEPALNQLLSELNEELTQLEANVKPSWSDLVEPLEQITERLTWSWGIVSHLMGVKNSPELRQAYETAQPQIVEFSNRLSQSKPIYNAFKALRESDTWNTLDSAQERIIESAIRDAELAGIGLEGEAQARFNAIQTSLAEISTKFSNHVLDATKAFSLTLVTPEEVEGLPASWLSLAAQTARDAGEENATPENGPWRVTLDFPSYYPFMQHSKRRDLRETLYKAF
ncbi:MAG: M3 family peptidase, partial [Rivularia sp. (in: cyanobacteria)]